ncbi:MAG: hypothetical protein PVI44_12860, partial [Balneolaceae bacterium]
MSSVPRHLSLIPKDFSAPPPTGGSGRNDKGFYRALDSEWRMKGEQNNFVPVHSSITISRAKGPSTL